VLYQTGVRKCSELGGLFRTMPLTCACGIIGALAISAFPFTSGFISKSMISSAAGYENLSLVWFLLIAASAGVFLHAGIKFPWFVFFQKDSGLRPPEAPWNMRIAMVLFSAACIVIGLFPNLLYGLLPYPVDYEPYTAEHVVSQLQLLLFAGLAFFVLLPLMKRTETISLDVDWLYRRAVPVLAGKIDRGLTNVNSGISKALSGVGNWFIGSFKQGSYRYFSSRAPMGHTALWMAAVLALFLVMTLLM